MAQNDIIISGFCRKLFGNVDYFLYLCTRKTTNKQSIYDKTNKPSAH